MLLFCCYSSFYLKVWFDRWFCAHKLGDNCRRCTLVTIVFHSYQPLYGYFLFLFYVKEMALGIYSKEVFCWFPFESWTYPFFLISKLHIPPVGFDPTTSPSACSCGRIKCHLSQSLLAHGHTLVSLHAWIALETSFMVTRRFFGFSRMDQQFPCLKV